jgi:hypothetical protein
MMVTESETLSRNLADTKAMLGSIEHEAKMVAQQLQASQAHAAQLEVSF